MTDRPKLLILSISNIASDPRVLKQVGLFRRDYEVSTCSLGPRVDGVSEHFRLADDARGWVNDKAALILRRYGKAYWQLPAVAEAKAALAGREFDIVIANDLNTVPLALSLGARKGVHADLHEFAPREREDDWKWRMFVAPFMRWLCRKYLVRVDSATTVGRGLARQYQQDYGVPFAVVTNAAPFVQRQPGPVNTPIRMIHSGAAQRSRALGNYIDAMRTAQPNVTLDFMVMPNEPEYLAELRESARSVPSVTFRDPVPYEKLVDTMAEYDVSLSFFPPVNFNQTNALPNKFFEAVQARIGQIIGPSDEMSAMVKQYRFGAIADDFSVGALARTIDSLTPETIGEWKRAANAAAGELSFETQSKGWVTAIQALAER